MPTCPSLRSLPGVPVRLAESERMGFQYYPIRTIQGLVRPDRVLNLGGVVLLCPLTICGLLVDPLSSQPKLKTSISGPNSVFRFILGHLDRFILRGREGVWNVMWEGHGDLVSILMNPTSLMYYSLNSLKGVI